MRLPTTTTTTIITTTIITARTTTTITITTTAPLSAFRGSAASRSIAEVDSGSAEPCPASPGMVGNQRGI
jgi:hypothetical protein